MFIPNSRSCNLSATFPLSYKSWTIDEKLLKLLKCWQFGGGHNRNFKTLIWNQNIVTRKEDTYILYAQPCMYLDRGTEHSFYKIVVTVTIENIVLSGISFFLQTIQYNDNAMRFVVAALELQSTYIQSNIVSNIPTSHAHVEGKLGQCHDRTNKKVWKCWRCWNHRDIPFPLNHISKYWPRVQQTEHAGYHNLGKYKLSKFG